MQYKELLAGHGQRGIRSAGVVAEFDLVHTGREAFDDRPDLATNHPMFREVGQQCNHAEQFKFRHGSPQSNIT